MLFSWRNTPNHTGVAPSDLVFKFKPRTKVTMLVPKEKIVNHDNFETDYKSVKVFDVGDKVLVRTQKRDQSVIYLLGRVIKKVSRVTYLVFVNHKTRFVHADHLKATNIDTEPENSVDSDLNGFEDVIFGQHATTPSTTPLVPAPQLPAPLPPANRPVVRRPRNRSLQRDPVPKTRPSRSLPGSPKRYSSKEYVQK